MNVNRIVNKRESVGAALRAARVTSDLASHAHGAQTPVAQALLPVRLPWVLIFPHKETPTSHPVAQPRR